MSTQGRSVLLLGHDYTWDPEAVRRTARIVREAGDRVTKKQAVETLIEEALAKGMTVEEVRVALGLEKK